MLEISTRRNQVSFNTPPIIKYLLALHKFMFVVTYIAGGASVIKIEGIPSSFPNNEVASRNPSKISAHGRSWRLGLNTFCQRHFKQQKTVHALSATFLACIIQL
jgi:hypothetical protein